MLDLLQQKFARLNLLLLVVVAVIVFATMGRAAGPFTFASIDGGTIDLADWRGKPVLLVNTASRCGYTPQYEGLQQLHEAYGPKGLLVLAVPSNDFRQELGSDEKVAEFCEVNFGLTLPMTTITHVRGPDAHPFYKWVFDTANFAPRWNFNKVLIGANGQVVQTWHSNAKPMSAKITQAIEAQLPRG